MKRRDPLPLLAPLEPDVYVIDTSAWLNIDSRRDREKVWRLIVSLVEQGRIVACAQVMAELRDDPIYERRLKPHEKALQVGEPPGDNIEYLRIVGRITHDYPAMSKAAGRKTPADSYVVALAELDHYVVVADERSTKRPNRKIPGVCQQLGIRCLTLDQFVAAANADESRKPYEQTTAIAASAEVQGGGSRPAEGQAGAEKKKGNG